MMRSFKVCFPFYLALVLLTYFVKDHAFFWDTVQLASKQAHWYFDNDFRYFFLPQEIDSGHPPFFGMLLALIWKIFGKTLWISHFLMLPFLLGIVFFVHQLGEYFLGKENAGYLLLLIVLDPFLLGQSILVSPDIVLVFGWLMALWSVIYERRFLLIFTCMLLAAISMRGMMVVFSVFLFDAYRLYNSDWSWRTYWKTFLSYVPAGIFALLFLFFHYKHTGWIGYHEGSSWAPLFERVSVQGFLRNIGLLGWRLLDFGRLFLWIIIGIGVLKIWKRGIGLTSQNKELMALFIATLLVLTPSMLLHKGLMAHRYLLPVVLIIDFIAVAILFKLELKPAFKKMAYIVMLLALFTGNFWVYPKHVAQGWDSALAHYPYYELRNKMIHYIDENQIPIEVVGTEFPMIGKMEFIDLNSREIGFHKKDFEKDMYILYSNVFNDFSDEELSKLETDFDVQKAFYSGQLCMILYKRKE